MAHFARIENGVVREVLVVRSSVIRDADGVEQESIGQAFLAGIFPDTQPSSWVQTSYNATIRGKYAGTGDTWDGFVFESPLGS